MLPCSLLRKCNSQGQFSLLSLGRSRSAYSHTLHCHSLYRRQLYKISHDGENGDSGEYLSLMEDAQGNPLSSVTLKCAGSPMASYVPDSMALAVFY